MRVGTLAHCARACRLDSMGGGEGGYKTVLHEARPSFVSTEEISAVLEFFRHYYGLDTGKSARGEKIVVLARKM
jgi:hypothetical protein